MTMMDEAHWNRTLHSLTSVTRIDTTPHTNVHQVQRPSQRILYRIGSRIRELMWL